MVSSIPKYENRFTTIISNEPISSAKFNKYEWGITLSVWRGSEHAICINNDKVRIVKVWTGISYENLNGLSDVTFKTGDECKLMFDLNTKKAKFWELASIQSVY